MKGVVSVQDRPRVPVPNPGHDRNTPDAEHKVYRFEPYGVQQQDLVEREVRGLPPWPDGGRALSRPEGLAELVQIGLFAFCAPERRRPDTHTARLTVGMGRATGGLVRARRTREPSSAHVMYVL